MITNAPPPLPRSFYIEPTTRCNQLCRQCPRTWLSREVDRDLSYEHFRRIVDQFPAIERVVLHGLGEPLLNEELPRMIRHLKERGAHVLFNSNGVLLTRERGQALTEARLGAGTGSRSMGPRATRYSEDPWNRRVRHRSG